MARDRAKSKNKLHKNFIKQMVDLKGPPKNRIVERATLTKILKRRALMLQNEPQVNDAFSYIPEELKIFIFEQFNSGQPSDRILKVFITN